MVTKVLLENQKKNFDDIPNIFCDKTIRKIKTTYSSCKKNVLNSDKYYCA